MKINRNISAILKGISIFLVISAISLALLYIDTASSSGYLVWIGVFVAGVVTAMTARSHKIWLSILLALPIALLIALENWVWRLLGKPSDFSGASGFFIVLTMFIPVGLVLSGAGGVLGWFIENIGKRAGDKS